MSKKLLVTTFAAMLTLVIVASAITVSAKPGPIYILYLQDQMGNPVKNKTFIVAVFDVTDNERIAGVEVTSDEDGKVEFELAEDFDPTHTYNMTIVIKEYGKTFAFYYIEDSGGTLDSLNTTAITGTHYWNLYFYAGTDLTNYPPTTCDVPVYAKDPQDPNVVDAAKVKVYVDGVEVWSGEVDETGVTKTTFNVSDLIVEVDSEYHVKEVANTTFLARAVWTEHELIISNETIYFELDDDVPTLDTPADEISVYDEVRGYYISWDPTWTVTESTTEIDISLTNGMSILARCYTRLLRVHILDWQGNEITVGSTPTKVFVEFRDFIVRSSEPMPNEPWAPWLSFYYDGSVYWFWLPDVEAVYGEHYSVEITYMNVLVYNETITFPGTVSYEHDAECSLIKVAIHIKDMEPVRQPLQSDQTTLVRVTISGPVTIVTYALAGGYCALPPYWTGAWIVGGYVINPSVTTESPGSVSIYWPWGYLPIPWGWAKANVEATYTVKVEWKTVWMDNYIDITHAGNETIELGVGDYGTDYMVLGEVYQVKMKIVDLCEQPLYAAQPSDEDPGAYPYAYIDIYAPDGTLVVRTTPTLKSGLVPIDKLPASSKVGGPYTVKLYWKCFHLEPVAVPEISNITELNVTGNIDEAVVFVFPIRNIEITITQWDNATRVIEGLNVTLKYPCWSEPWETTNEEGKVKFYRVPVTDITGASYLVQAYTTSPTYGAAAKTPYIRDKDANLLVLNRTVEVPFGLCTYEVTWPAWIYSFYIHACDTSGNVLKSLEVWRSAEGIKYYNVTILFCDTDPNFQIINITWIGNKDVTPSAYYDPVHGTTGPEAIYLINSNQSSTYPHLFVAGAKYFVRVFYGGVMVFNYTITMPVPDPEVTADTHREQYFNETEFCRYLNTTLVDEPYHKILTMEPVEPWTEKPVIKLYTWVVPTKLYALTNGEESVVSKVAFALGMEKVLSAVFTGRASYYAELCDVGEGTWSSYATNYIYYEVDADGDGEVSMLVPVWVPTNACKLYIDNLPGWIHWNDVWFGSTVANITVMGSKDFGTPGIVTDGIYALNYKVVDSTEYIGTAAAAITPWNITNWASDWTKVRTLVLDCIKVQVYGPDLRGENRPLPWQLVEIYVGDTLITWGYKTTDDPYTFEPPVVGSIALPDGTTMPVIDTWYLFKYTNHTTFNYTDGAKPFAYTFKVRQHFDEHEVIKNALGVASAKGITVPLRKDPVTGEESFTSTYFNVEKLAKDIELTKDHECGATTVDLYWNAIYVYLMDFDGKALAEMTVFAFRTGSALPATFTITATNGTAVLYVAENGPYWLEVYWRDTWFLEQCRIIPRSINIYSSADERIQWYAGQTATMQAYAYIGLLKLTKADGTPLSEAALKKITVEVTWPDGVVTTHKPEADGTVKLIMNKDTVIKGPPKDTELGILTPESPHPQTPVGDYTVKVYWDKLVVYEAPVSIIKYRVGPAEQLRPIKTNVVDFTITLTTPFGTVMKGATGTVTKADGTTETFAAEDGTVKVVEAPLGKVTVKVERWKGVDVAYETEVTGKVGEAITVTVAKVGKLKVVVQGARGQGLAGADVVIKLGDKVVEKGTTAEDGTYVTELPVGTYTVEISKAGRKKTVTGEVAEGAVGEAKATLDIFIEVAGWYMSSTEFTGIVAGIILLVIVLFLLFHEYSVWRKKRLAAAIVPAKPGA